MSPEFRSLLENIPSLFRKLQGIEPVDIKDFPTKCIKKGVYLFTDPDTNEYLYVGRSDNIRRRWGLHRNNGSQHNQASFALRIARDKTNTKPDYKLGTENQFLKYPDFKRAFEDAKKQIQKMKFRYVEVVDPETQCLLEFYAAVTLDTPYNNFENH